jgi:hypothetical protein
MIGVISHYMDKLVRCEPYFDRVNFALKNVRVGVMTHEHVNEWIGERKKTPHHWQNKVNYGMLLF